MPRNSSFAPSLSPQPGPSGPITSFIDSAEVASSAATFNILTRGGAKQAVRLVQHEAAQIADETESAAGAEAKLPPRIGRPCCQSRRRRRQHPGARCCSGRPAEAQPHLHVATRDCRPSSWAHQSPARGRWQGSRLHQVAIASGRHGRDRNSFLLNHRPKEPPGYLHWHCR